MKRICTLILALFMSLSLAACGGNTGTPDGGASAPPAASASPDAEPPSGESTTLRLAWTVAYQDDHPYTVAAESFKKYVEENTDGRVKVELYAGGQLGGDAEMMEMLQMGTLDVAVTSTPTIANFTDVLVGCDMPYIWHNDLQAMYSVLTEGDIGRQLLDRMQEEVGIVGLSFLYQPFRHFYTNKPIETLNDMAGLKLRCMQTPVHMAIFETLGCKPVSLPYNDIYSAMQQSTIDGFESDAMGGTASKFYEVADYLTISGHFNNTMVLLMSNTSYGALSAEDQAVCMAAATEAAAASLKTSIEANDFHIQNMQDNGMTLCTPDMEPFYAAVQPLIDQYCQDIPEAKTLVDAAQAAVG